MSLNRSCHCYRPQVAAAEIVEDFDPGSYEADAGDEVQASRMPDLRLKGVKHEETWWWERELE